MLNIFFVKSGHIFCSPKNSQKRGVVSYQNFVLGQHPKICNNFKTSEILKKARQKINKIILQATEQNAWLISFKYENINTYLPSSPRTLEKYYRKK